MSFRQSVRETFSSGKLKRRVTVLSALGGILLSMGIARHTDPVLLYAFFLSMLGWTITLYPFPERIYDHPSWQVRNLPRPVLLTLGTYVFALGVLLVVRPLPISGETFESKAWMFFMFGLIAPSVEEFARWTWLHTLPYSPVTSTGFWVLLHPQVARVFSGQTPDLAFILFAALFGVLMMAVMWMVESRHGGRYFGPIAAITLHGAYNVTVILWSIPGMTVF
jgi:hypothetical protein